ncbi:MAG: hypothetical protein II811_00060 [Spirochaetaceae bacterium]|nr:hypothetical protein [Spirochaetaceae bacterium]
MRTMGQKEALDRLPDDNMAKRVITAIINTPRPDFTQLNKDVDEYIASRLAEMSEEQRERLRTME